LPSETCGCEHSRSGKTGGLENSSTVASAAEAAELLAELAAPGDLVLIKGSRLARTEQVIEAFRNRQSIIANSP
jgi:UDP-N-acetylmuramyl pentapeptide synthase